ncbi:phosphoribosylanthranilate isomerase [Caenispirillum bisanense]|uniref:N-(5'-phosphoribosyl)anthranilate isomerase n=2 Tax=Caenispirillum bisanense TaxID=414052 RepID=A0A286G8F8_9PROT|nr:phosphoribosylanthranilate isomerase [Caenispirillum bisanense]
MPLVAKICGLTDEDALVAAVEGGADYVGLVFFPPSPRAITPEAAAELLDGLPEDVKAVGLFVDPTDDQLAEVLGHVRLAMVQLHGTETPARVEQIRQDWGVPVIKALGIATAEDLKAAEAYADVADMLLFDAKAPAGSDRPGGHGTALPWDLLRGWSRPDVPWMLAGGLTPDTVTQAARTAGAAMVDVSSGVERSKGVKDPDLIRRFLDACAEA